MTAPLSGVRVVEVATHVFVPMSGSVLTEWGAEVTKIEHPVTGDPYRGLVTAGLHKLYKGIDPAFQSANRGKRSVALDLKQEEGRRLLSRILETTDVFVTNLTADARRRLHIEVEDIRADNPSIIYMRGTAFGARGPEAGRGGYDSGAYFGRSGMQYVFTPPGQEWPATPRPAFGDVVGGLTIAGAITTALYRRASTGEPSVIDVSLLATGMWQLQMDIMNAALDGGPTHRAAMDRYESWNPLMMPYRTSDGRIIALQMLSPDHNWANLCATIGQPEMTNDPRFVDMAARRANAQACVEWLEGVFAQRTFEEWRKVLADLDGEWTPIQGPHEVPGDPQVEANGYLAELDAGNDIVLPVVVSPVQFDEQPGRPVRAPEHGEHTEETLLALGLSWEQLSELKARRTIV